MLFYRQKYFYLHFLIFLLLLGFGLSGCATAPRRAVIEQKKEFFLKDLCRHYGLSWEWDHVVQMIRLKDKSNDVRLFVGSRVMFVGDKKFSLSAPVELRNSLIVIPRDFLRFIVIHVQVRPKEGEDYSIKKVQKILIDAGHGGKDPGAIGWAGTYEKDIVLDVAYGLKKFLEKEGFDVSLTRTEDKFLTLKERTEIATESDIDLFISIHANASFNKRVQGVEVFSLQNLEEKERNEEQRKDNEKMFLKKATGSKQVSEALTGIVSDMLYAYKQPESDSLATSVAQESIKYTRAVNRGVKYAHFYVLRNTLIPSILVEIGFLSNKQEETSLKKLSYQQKIIEGIGKGIIHYANN